MWSLTMNQCCGSKAEVEAQGGAPVISADSRTEGVEFSEITDTSGEDSGTGGDREAIQQRPRPLRQFARIIVSST